MAKKESSLDKEQMLSTVLGMIVVFVVGILVYRYFQSSQIETDDVAREALLEEENQTKESDFILDLPVDHSVARGESLWKIAEKYYGSGYNWVDIAGENNLTDPGFIAAGQKLKIPDVSSREKTVLAHEQEIGESLISGQEYTVGEGDWLSKIALRAYGDMFAWEKIYEANKETIGSNPNVLIKGTTLVIPN